ncbi:MAG: tol-pal system protein YbgF [Desulfobacteraceae bacterium]|jgi:tol-pal system protein YbgF
MKTILYKGTRGFCRLVLSIILPIAFLASCVYDQEMTYLNDQMIALNKRVIKLEGLLGSDLDTRLGSVHSRQAEVGAEMDQLRTEIGELSGRVEDNEQLIKRSVEKDLGKEDAIVAGLAALSQKVSELEVLVSRQQEHLGLKTPRPKEDREQVRVPSGQEGTVPKRPVIIEAPRSEELNLYDTSMASFKEGKYEDAMRGFETLIKKYPDSDRADNAQFWIGECYMGIKKYEKAILAYQEVIKKYPKGNKVPSAMLRQAIAFLEIKDKTSTRLLLKKIINKYPESSEAQIAKKKLEALK